MGTRAAPLVVLVLRGGCASSGGTWTKSGVTQQELGREQQDHPEARRQALAAERRV